jgi:hypothetical protein
MRLRLFLCLLLSTVLIGPGTAHGSQYVIGDRPEPLVWRPFPCPPGAFYDDDDEEARVQVHVGADGFVDSTFFNGSAPPDSAIVQAIARRWIFRPATFWAAGPHPGEPRAAWLAIPYRGGCERKHSGQRIGRHVLEQPDSVLRTRVRDAGKVTVWRLIPPNAENAAAAWNDPGSIETDRLYMHWIKATRVDSTGAVQRALIELLDDPRSRRGPDPIDRRCLPEPDLGIALVEFFTAQTTMIYISSGCDLMQIVTPEAVLLLPYAPLREQVLELARSLFPYDAAYFPSMKSPRR